MEKDNWTDRATGMVCATCRFFVPKKGTRGVGRCRRHAPTMDGYPVVFPTDWCGDHKLHEDEVEQLQFGQEETHDFIAEFNVARQRAGLDALSTENK